MPDTRIIGRSRCHDIIFFASGRIDICARISRQLSLRPGDIVDILRSGPEHYLIVTCRADAAVGRHRGTVHTSSRAGHHMRLYSRPLASYVLSLLGNPKCAAINAGAPCFLPNFGTTIPLIIRNPLYHDQGN